MFGVDAGTLEQKGQMLEAFFFSIWRLCMKEFATSRRSNVATSPRRDVPTSRRWVNQYRSQQSETSQRRDVSTGSAPHHLKHQWFRMRGIGRRTNEGTEFQSSSDTDFEEVPVICTVSNFWILE